MRENECVRKRAEAAERETLNEAKANRSRKSYTRQRIP